VEHGDIQLREDGRCTVSRTVIGAAMLAGIGNMGGSRDRWAGDPGDSYTAGGR
jgi:hypothetical protein